MPELIFRKFYLSDQASILNWPPYPLEFAELDYALRSDGWLDEFRDQPDTDIYVAELDKHIVGFTILSKTGQAAAEFRIAIRADELGHGIGKLFAATTLNSGFTKMGLSRIHLIVRKNNLRAIRLYKKLGFSISGESSKTISGKSVDFLEMIMMKPAQ
jgi:RimJ/RimL family protein N-acetyltransferase